MATVLLTDDEYKHIRGLMNDLMGKVPTASPRAATHYAAIAKQHADFIAKEDGKRATQEVKTTTRDTILQAKQARKNGTGAATQGATQTANTRPNAKSA